MESHLAAKSAEGEVCSDSLQLVKQVVLLGSREMACYTPGMNMLEEVS